ncbi:deubiquitinase MYSM1-like [Ornithodoros turicata]|uniref:deubiquitinase MYSM1-like n=1 Tax=Ornithodoros turicata TaxID=34597 RepID=UPI003139390F
MASYESEACCWESVDIETEVDTSFIGQQSCDNLLEFNEPFRPLWQSTDDLDVCYENLVEHDDSKHNRNRALTSSDSSQNPQREKGTASNTRKRWTKEEEAQLLQCMKEYGKKWSKIATIIRSKNTIQVKTHAHYLLKKKRQNLDHYQPALPSSEDELLKSIVRSSKRSPRKPKEPDENVIILKDAAAVEHLKNKFPASEIINIKKQADDDVESDEDVNIDSSDERENTDEDLVGQQSVKVEAMEIRRPEQVVADDAEKNVLIGDDSKTADFPVVFDIPVCEAELDADHIGEEEKMVHKEFFSGRFAKTPERYLKIRNHILEAWQKHKPNYMNKTSARQGLKNCGDVNCIGRIHHYLEQIGAINFGCPQVVYQKERPEAKKIAAKKYDHVEVARLPRRKVAATDISSIDVRGGGMTMEHGLTGDVISHTLIPSKSKVPKPRPNPFKLVPCRKFDSDQEPFSIHVSTAVMLLMDAHSHLVETEVIGLLGGCYDAEKRILFVSAAEPCDSVSTDLECEMDPVSQAAALESLLVGGYDVVGWYHSHPTFVPNPSMRDLTTQADYQAMFSNQGQPFVAAILSPYLPPSSLQSPPKSLTSKARWWISQHADADRDGNGRSAPHLDSVPYSFDATLIKMDASQLVDFKTKIQFLKARIDSNPAKVDLLVQYPWQPTVTYLHKMLTSLQLHLTNSETDTDVAGEILQGIHSVFAVIGQS